MQGKNIRTILIHRDMSITDLANRLGKSVQNFSNQLIADNFKESTLMEIAEALNCTLEIKFIDNETGKPFTWTYNTTKANT